MSTTRPRIKAKEREQAPEAAAPLPPPTGPARFYNRELSWLQFNRRVLEEAENLRHPLLERLRFLSISASNLDEFYMVRVAGLYGQVAAGVVQTSQDGLTPAQQLAEINRFASGLVNDQQTRWGALKAEMATAGILMVEPKELSAFEREWLERHFLAQHLPILTPIALDPAHPFPFIQNGALTVGVELRRERDGTNMHALLPIPSQLVRFIRLPTDPAAAPEERAPPIRFIRIESVIGMFISRLFPGFIARSQGAFRVLRDSDIEIEEDAEDLVRYYRTAIQRRRRGSVIVLQLQGDFDPVAEQLLRNQLGLDHAIVIQTDGLVGIAFAPDGQRIVTGSLDATARIWDAATGAELRRFTEHHDRVLGVAFSPEGRRILSTDETGTALLWEAATGRVLLTLKGHSGYIWCAAFSPDGRRVLTGSFDKTAKLWETVSGGELLTFKDNDEIRAVAFSPNGQRIATGCSDGTVKLWDVATPAQVRAWQEEERAAAKRIEALRRNSLAK
jgi:hypothetical protein